MIEKVENPRNEIYDLESTQFEDEIKKHGFFSARAFEAKNDVPKSTSIHHDVFYRWVIPAGVFVLVNF